MIDPGSHDRAVTPSRHQLPPVMTADKGPAEVVERQTNVAQTSNHSHNGFILSSAVLIVPLPLEYRTNNSRHDLLSPARTLFLSSG